MTSSRLLRNLIRAGAEGDRTSFRSVASEVINEERRKQHHLLANDLEAIVYGAPRRLDPLNDIQVPVDRERGIPLLDLRVPVRKLDHVELTRESALVIERVLQEHRRADELASYGMVSTRRLLFFGPPGCGKTITAEAMAFELDRPFAVIRLDSVVSSLLGETASNLRSIFEFIEKMPLVVLFDEFDGLGRTRKDDSEHGEMRRVVNAVLQLMEGLKGQSIIIAATNLEESLDAAIWRRFEEVVQFGLPDSTRIKRYITERIRGVRTDIDLDELPLSEWFVDWSYSDIERVVLRAIKEMILGREDHLCRRHFERAYESEHVRRIALTK